MVIGDRLRTLREEKNLSQGDMEKKTGLLRCYISRVENGHTVPSLETLEKLARAMEIPMYQLFYEGNAPPSVQKLPKRRAHDEVEWGSNGKERRMLGQFCRALSKTDDKCQKLLLGMAQKMARPRRLRA